MPVMKERAHVGIRAIENSGKEHRIQLVTFPRATNMIMDLRLMTNCSIDARAFSQGQKESISNSLQFHYLLRCQQDVISDQTSNPLAEQSTEAWG